LKIIVLPEIVDEETNTAAQAVQRCSTVSYYILISLNVNVLIHSNRKSIHDTSHLFLLYYSFLV